VGIARVSSFIVIIDFALQPDLLKLEYKVLNAYKNSSLLRRALSYIAFDLKKEQPQGDAYFACQTFEEGNAWLASVIFYKGQVIGRDIQSICQVLLL